MRKKNYFLSMLFAASCSLGAFAQTAVPLKSSTPASHGNFGASIATHNGVTVVGAPREGSGAIHIFNGNTWIRKHANTNSQYDGFGESVAINRNWVAVGSYQKQFVSSLGTTGFVILGRLSLGNLGYYIFPTDLQDWDLFGKSVAMTDTWMAIGAPGQGNGVVYMYKEWTNGTDRGWNFMGKLAGANLTSEAGFGSSVAIHGDKLVVGAPDHSNVEGERAGRIYIYRRSNDSWILEHQFTPTQVDSYDNYGYDVDITDNHVIVGAEGYDNSRGLAQILVFSNGAWRVKNNLVGPVPNSRFGISVALQFNRALVGAPYQGSNGELHLYTDQGGYIYKGTLYTANSADFGLGYAADIESDMIATSALHYTSNGVTSGIAYRMNFNDAINSGSKRIGFTEAEVESSETSQKLYPNPASGNIVNYNTASSISSVQAVDPLGVTTVLGFNGNTIDISILPAGVYILEIVTEAGTELKKLSVL